MVNALIVGGGRMGAEPSDRLHGILDKGWLPISHAECFLNNKNITSVGIVETNTKRLKYLKEIYPSIHFFSSLDDAFSRINYDILSIATRTPEKKGIIEHAVKKNIKSIYVEKPFLNNLEDTKKILDLLSTNNVNVLVGVNRRYHPSYTNLKKIIDNKSFGDLKSLVFEFGASPLLWSQVHALDLSLFYSGKYKDLSFSFSNIKIDGNNIVSDPVLENGLSTSELGIKSFFMPIDGFNLTANLSEARVELNNDAAEFIIYKKDVNGYFKERKEVLITHNHSATEIAFKNLIEDVIDGTNKSASLMSIDEIYNLSAFTFASIQSCLPNDKKIENIFGITDGKFA